MLSGSRPVIDKMWLPKPRQVGTSGKTVRPKVYLAMAISGAFQHIAGMKDSDCIIAVNKDPEAPIFQYAHFGVICDANKLRDKMKDIAKKDSGEETKHRGTRIADRERNCYEGMNGEGDREKQVLVVGGGIGGITAGLELASCGVKVTMLEEGPSIGGRMIQLDKTFPTLDCSTCTLSPKMVEVALAEEHRASLLGTARGDKERRAGALTVTIRKKARFVDMKKCTACGTCFPGCPVVMKSEFNMGTGMRKAIYIPFPQAIPNKASIDKRTERPCKAACMDACPVHTNVLGYLKHISEGRFSDAYLLIRETNPFPSVCGRVCYAPCERACNRGQLDAPLAIRDCKRFAADRFDLASLEVPQVQKTEKKAAVIGAGPAGLACAHDLALAGHEVTVFEASAEPGGMLRYAIPEYRLPKSRGGERDRLYTVARRRDHGATWRSERM